MKTRELSLVKDGEEYVFRYESGREDEVIDEILRHARDVRSPLDWTDAARLSFQVAQLATTD